MIQRTKFYEMQNFAISLLLAADLKQEETITLGINLMNYSEEQEIALISFIPLQRYSKALNKDVLGYLNDRFLNFKFHSTRDQEGRFITIFVTKKA